MAAYLLNREPLVPLDSRLSKEAGIEKQVNHSHLRVFDCIFYVYIDAEIETS